MLGVYGNRAHSKEKSEISSISLSETYAIITLYAVIWKYQSFLPSKSSNMTQNNAMRWLRNNLVMIIANNPMKYRKVF